MRLAPTVVEKIKAWIRSKRQDLRMMLNRAVGRLAIMGRNGEAWLCATVAGLAVQASVIHWQAQPDSDDFLAHQLLFVMLADCYAWRFGQSGSIDSLDGGMAQPIWGHDRYDLGIIQTVP